MEQLREQIRPVKMPSNPSARFATIVTLIVVGVVVLRLAALWIGLFAVASGVRYYARRKAMLAPAPVQTKQIPVR